MTVAPGARRRLVVGLLFLVTVCSGCGAHALGKVVTRAHQGAPTQRLEPALPQVREEGASAAVHGKLYVMGGFGGLGQDTDVVYVFDGKRWSPGPHLPIPLDHLAATVAAGQLYVAGGFGSMGATDRVFRLSASGQAWQDAGRLQQARGALALVAPGGVLLAVGGKDAAGNEIPNVEAYDPKTGRWRVVSRLPGPRDHLAGFAYRGWACVAGGRSPNTARVDCYDPARRTWHRLANLPVATSGAGAASYSGEVMVGGGELAAEGGGVIPQLAVLRGGHWVTYHMLVPRHGVEFSQFRGRVWACGGGNQPGLHPVKTCTSMGW